MVCGLTIEGVAASWWGLHVVRLESVAEERGGLAALATASGPDVLASLALIVGVTALLTGFALHARSRDAWWVASGLQLLFGLEGLLRLSGTAVWSGLLLVGLVAALTAALLAPGTRHSVR